MLVPAGNRHDVFALALIPGIEGSVASGDRLGADMHGHDQLHASKPDVHPPVDNLVIGNFTNKRRQIGHRRILSTRRFGGPQTATKSTYVKTVVTASPKLISRIAA
jgi:hypothetical protein